MTAPSSVPPAGDIRHPDAALAMGRGDSSMCAKACNHRHGKGVLRTGGTAGAALGCVVKAAITQDQRDRHPLGAGHRKMTLASIFGTWRGSKSSRRLPSAARFPCSEQLPRAPNRCTTQDATTQFPRRIHIAFDDHRLVANAGLLLPVTLAQHLGLPQLVQQRLDLGNAPGRGTPDKIVTLVASALAGGLHRRRRRVAHRRDGWRSRLRVKAPSTLGTFLRSFRWGHRPPDWIG